MKKAFSLIEVIIALFVVSLGVITALSLTLRGAYFQKNQSDLLTAGFLAQEGLELAINIRDTNIINNHSYNDWTGNGALSPHEEKYRLDLSYLIAEKLENEEQETLQEDEGGFFLHDNHYPDSKFKRRLSVFDTDHDFSLLNILLNWEQRGEVYSYQLDTILYDLSF